MTPSPRQRGRVLLALDGNALSRDLLGRALRRCLHLDSRLDILLINPPSAPTSLLAVLLLQLEHSGVDYRIVSARGHFAEQVLRYIRRYRGIAAVVVASLEQVADMPEPGLQQLENEGHHFIALSEPD